MKVGRFPAMAVDDENVKMYVQNNFERHTALRA